MALRFFFSRRSESRNHRKNRGRKSSRRANSLRLGFESLESRQLLSASGSTMLTFNIPSQVASQGVYAGLYSNKSQLYLDPSNGQFLSYSKLGTSVPLFTLASPTQNSLPASPDPVTYPLTIPLTQDVVSGELFIFVGLPTTGLAYSNNAVAAPKAASSPAIGKPSDNFAQFEFDYEAAKGLDIDISAVDSTGFPFTIVYPPSAGLSYPLTTLGITLDQTDLNQGFQAAFGTGGQHADHPEFTQCATYGTQLSSQDLQVIAPQDILAAEVVAPQMNAVKLNSNDPNGNLTAGCNYYYRLTAFSNNEIDNSGGALGETLLSDYVNVVAASIVPKTSVTLSWNQYHDPNTAGYNIYRYSSTDGTPPTDSSAYSLIAHVYGAATTSYTDDGAIPQGKQTSVATATNYGFNPLSQYYTSELQAFFAHYAAPNSFALHMNGALWVGNTATYTPSASWNTTGASYTVLQLTAQNSVAGTAIQQGDVINVYQPFFASNTSSMASPMPVMPGWMQAKSDLHESPAQMVFGCDTVFASNKYDPDVAGNGDLATALGAVENSIVSAFNRGVATNYAIQPDNWAAFPQMLNAPVVAADPASQVTDTTTYCYAVSAVNAYGETTLGMTVGATLAPGQSATLNWANGANAVPATAYKIYRGTSPDNLKLLRTVNGQTTSCTDEGAPSSGGAAPGVPVLRRGDDVELVRRVRANRQHDRPGPRRQHQRPVVRVPVFRPGGRLDQYLLCPRPHPRRHHGQSRHGQRAKLRHAEPARRRRRLGLPADRGGRRLRHGDALQGRRLGPADLALAGHRHGSSQRHGSRHGVQRRHVQRPGHQQRRIGRDAIQPDGRRGFANAPESGRLVQRDANARRHRRRPVLQHAIAGHRRLRQLYDGALARLYVADGNIDQRTGRRAAEPEGRLHADGHYDGVVRPPEGRHSGHDIGQRPDRRRQPHGHALYPGQPGAGDHHVEPGCRGAKRGLLPDPFDEQRQLGRPVQRHVGQPACGPEPHTVGRPHRHADRIRHVPVHRHGDGHGGRDGAADVQQFPGPGLGPAGRCVHHDVAPRDRPPPPASTSPSW